ncbi:hypothetical protein M405DRAFT_864417, partial [Rhizopogon salebrosus TDB-379]
CPQWDETRLLAAAEQRVDAQLQPAHRAQPVNPPRQAPAAPRPAPAAARGRLVVPPRQAPAVPRPAPVFPPRQAPAAAPRPVPFVDVPVNYPEQVPVTVRRGRPGAVINVPPTTHRAEAPERAPAPAPAPAPAQALTWATLAAENARNRNSRVLEPQPAPAVNTASKIPGRKLGSNARPVRFVSSRVRIGRENDEMDSQLRAGELNDLLKEPTVNQLARRWGGVDIEPDAQCDETVAMVGNPECLDSGVVVDDVLSDDEEELEHRAIPSPMTMALLEVGRYHSLISPLPSIDFVRL